jgi:hypothetical protein
MSGDARVPRFTIDGCYPDDLYVEVDGKRTTPEEAEAAAVLVACMRRGWTPLRNPRIGHIVLDANGNPLTPMGWSRTPAAAYLAALEESE